ncbi:glycosyltransferase family A protein [Psychrobacter sp. BI730]|uniref:glycosyltransferase family 2 protein n=1 Tax=Psychrobacter sp. BI730 TaxID=2705463 RepID=UPI0015CC12D7|nr:glycosyltransferase family A protein [Psychrobacter sp. BI730]NYR08697.1 glycosyltransferase family 2 protein [Psychrobacter sp. BI730]
MPKFIFRIPTYYQQIQKRNFAQALALLPNYQWTITSKRRWMCARLGIYTPLLEAEWRGGSVRAGVAYVQALSAYGKLEECEKVINRLIKRPTISRYLPELIRELAKYNLPLAIKLIHTLPTAKITIYHRALQSAYLLQNKAKNNQPEKTLDNQTLVAHRELILNSREHPDLLLLESNWQANTHTDKLYYLNNYQSLFDLPNYKVIDDNAIFDSLNLQVENSIYTALLSMNKEKRFRVSILTTMYNASKYIRSTLESFLNQSWHNIEVILIDDASTDDSLSIAQEVANKDPRIKIIHQETNTGTFLAKNNGLRYASGEFIICHDSDDWAHPLKIEHQVMPLFLDQTLMATTSDWIKIDNQGSYFARAAFPYKQKNPASLMFRRHTLKYMLQDGFLWQPFRTGADSELFERFKLVFGSQSIRHVSKPLTLGAHRSDSLMNAKHTGTQSTDSRIQRLQYWEKWRLEHIEMLRRAHY